MVLHGDGVKDIAFSVEDCRSLYKVRDLQLKVESSVIVVCMCVGSTSFEHSCGSHTNRTQQKFHCYRILISISGNHKFNV